MLSFEYSLIFIWDRLIINVVNFNKFGFEIWNFLVLLWDSGGGVRIKFSIVFWVEVYVNVYDILIKMWGF